MLSEYAQVYRGLLREIRKAVTQAPVKPNQTIVSSFRALLEQSRQTHDANAFQDVKNALLFLKSQREHQARYSVAPFLCYSLTLFSQILVERYNPTTGLTEKERIRKTANRVGLDIPKEPSPEQ
ncbi:hypothetical protein P691DRAFT_660770 [Macrolepiota fuliginosa MF-IS2]|uniref:Uncharacterized protein n=1 Tax=Macrolepiota fuliginosa MF-IS2 TaxID=1400762 RepID=A0A9P5XMX4_9AGAR|nr:hypothetical protein P691DRAFT_660770 [Macrolepiota fuliginosa MF-IS2]